MESAAISNGVSTPPVESATALSSSVQQIPVSVHSAKVDGQTEGVRASEVEGTYFAEVAGPPSVTTSGSSLAGAEARLAYIVNLFA